MNEQVPSKEAFSWPTSKGDPIGPVWSYGGKKGMYQAEALRAFAHDLVDRIKEFELPVREAMKAAAGDGLNAFAYCRILQRRLDGKEREIERLQRENAGLREAMDLDHLDDRKRAVASYSAHEPESGPMAPIACIRVGEDDTCEVYAPGLPPGEHDVYPAAPSQPPRALPEPPASLGEILEWIHSMSDDAPVKNMARTALDKWEAIQARASQPPEVWRPKSEPIPAEAFAFTYGDYWINLPPHPQLPTSTKRADPPGSYRDATGELVIPSRPTSGERDE